MIELDKSREEMLAVIGASESLFGHPAIDPESPDLTSLEQLHFEITAHTRDEILPQLRDAVRRRFDWLSEGRLFHELFLPLKRGLGNAFKRGNAENAGKWIRSEVALTGAGIFVEIRDDGEGFDVEGVLTRFRNNEHYFTNHGSGFVTLDRSTAIVSYADGGRTIRISYRCPARDERDETLAGTDDESFMRDVLQAGLPMLKKQRGELLSLRIVEPKTPACPRRRELGYELELRQRGSAAVETLGLTGRILDPAAAQTDYAVARTLARGPFRMLTPADSAQIPEPMSAFKGQPHLVLYPLRGVEDFAGYLAAASEDERLRALARVATGLRAWHRSGLKAIRQRPLDGWLAGRSDALEQLCGSVPQCQSETLVRVAERLRDRARTLQPAELVPCHGGFGWDCLLRRGDTLFFYEFEHTCAAHPGLDVGGFVADLRASALGTETGFLARAEQAFLESYEPGDWAAADLDFFVAHSALQRLEACVGQVRTEQIDRWLDVADGAA